MILWFNQATHLQPSFFKQLCISETTGEVSVRFGEVHVLGKGRSSWALWFYTEKLSRECTVAKAPSVTPEASLQDRRPPSFYVGPCWWNTVMWRKKPPPDRERKLHKENRLCVMSAGFWGRVSGWQDVFRRQGEDMWWSEFFFLFSFHFKNRTFIRSSSTCCFFSLLHPSSLLGFEAGEKKLMSTQVNNVWLLCWWIDGDEYICKSSARFAHPCILSESNYSGEQMAVVSLNNMCWGKGWPGNFGSDESPGQFCKMIISRMLETPAWALVFQNWPTYKLGSFFL